MGRAAERPAQGGRSPSGSCSTTPPASARRRRAQQPGTVGIRPGPQRRPEDREAGVRSGHGLRLLDARLYHAALVMRDRSPASRTTSSPSKRCSGRSASRSGGSSTSTGGEKYGRHPSHGLGMPARELARIAYCMLRARAMERRAGDPEVVRRGDSRTHARVKGIKSFGRNAESSRTAGSFRPALEGRARASRRTRVSSRAPGAN